MTVAGHHIPVWYDEASPPPNGYGVFWNATTKRFEPAAVDTSALDTAGLATDAELTAGLATKQDTIPPDTYVGGVASTAAVLAAAPGPSAATKAYVSEFAAMYRFVAADATAADNFRVIAPTGGTAGRWILDGPAITLHPIGGTSDDWVRVMAAAAAMAYHGEVRFAEGNWLCKSKQVTPSGAVFRGSPGVSIVTTITPSLAEDGCPFFSLGGAENATTTTLSGAAALGATTVTVTDASAISVGDRILIRAAVYPRCWREVLVKAGSVLTLDRPLVRAFASGAEVAKIATARDIKIHGGGMRMSGSGDRIVHFHMAADCLVEDIYGSGTWSYFAISYDNGSRDSHIKRCRMDCGGSGSAFALEYSEQCTIEDCHSRRSASAGVLLTGCDSCEVRGGYHTQSAGYGLWMTTNHVTDTWGSRNCRVFGGSYNKNVTGILVDNGSSGNNIIGAETSDNSQHGTLFSPGAANSAPTDNRIMAGTAKRNAQSAVAESGGGKGNKVVGQVAIDNGSVGNVVYLATAGCELDVDGCVIRDSGVIASAHGMILASGASTVVRVRDTWASSVRAAGYGSFVEVAVGAKAFIEGRCTYVPTVTSGSVLTLGIFVSNGTAVIDGYQQTAGSDGVYLTANTACARIGERVDLSACASPITKAGGLGTTNRGVANLTAATPLNLGFIDTKATDRLFWEYVTDLGATGVVITGLPSVGSGFTIVGKAGDTSAIAYEIR